MKKFLRRKKLLFFLALILVLAVTLGAKMYQGSQDQAETVKTQEVKRQDLETLVYTTGRVEAQNKEQIYAKITGVVKNVAVEQGETVTVGQALILFDNEELVRKAAEAKAALLTRQAAYEEKRMQLEKNMELKEIVLSTAEAEYQRQQQLFDQGAVSAKELETAKTKYQQASLEYKQAEEDRESIETGGATTVMAQLEQAKVELAAVEEKLKSATLTASMKGMVTLINVEEGQYVSQGTPLVTIADPKHLLVKAAVSETDGRSVEQGQVVRVEYGSGSDVTIKGEVAKIAPVAVTSSTSRGAETTIDIEINIIDGSDLLRPGNTVDLSLITASKKGALVVPYESLMKEDDEDYVFVVENGKAVRKAVTKGISNDMVIEIKSGLEKGQQVIVNPTEKIKDGLAIEIEQVKDDD